MKEKQKNLEHFKITYYLIWDFSLKDAKLSNRYNVMNGLNVHGNVIILVSSLN